MRSLLGGGLVDAFDGNSVRGDVSLQISCRELSLRRVLMSSVTERWVLLVMMYVQPFWCHVVSILPRVFPIVSLFLLPRHVHFVCFYPGLSMPYIRFTANLRRLSHLSYLLLPLIDTTVHIATIHISPASIHSAIDFS